MTAPHNTDRDSPSLPPSETSPLERARESLTRTHTWVRRQMLATTSWARRQPRSHLVTLVVAVLVGLALIGALAWLVSTGIAALVDALTGSEQAAAN